MIDAIPLWALFAGTIVLVIVSVEAGYRLGNARHKQSEDVKESPVSAIANAMLGLTAFLLAFSFGIVSDRYDSRKELVREEAVAIRTAWKRTDFLPEPDRAEASAALRRHVEMRLAFAEARDLEPAKVQRFLAEAEQLQDRLWSMAVAHAANDMNSDVGALYFDSLNRVSELHELRVAVAIQARMPVEIWLALYCIMILGMMSVGYQTGIAGSKRSIVSPLLALSFALVFGLIASLDRSDSRIMKVTQQPLISLRDAMVAAASRPK